MTDIAGSPVPMETVGHLPAKERVRAYLDLARPSTPPREKRARTSNDVLEASSRNHPLDAILADSGEESEREEPEHGTMAGTTPMGSRWAFRAEQLRDGSVNLGLHPLPTSGKERHEWESCSATTARREIPWSSMSGGRRATFQKAADKHWKTWLENDAVRVLSPEETAQVRKKLKADGEEDRIVRGRFVLTDKNDGLRTDTIELPLDASSRLVIPGYKVKENLEGLIRRDAPTGARNSQHALFILAGCRRGWRLAKGDVRAAFLKGDPLRGEGRQALHAGSRLPPRAWTSLW